VQALTTEPATGPPLPAQLRIGHLTFTLVQDDQLVAEHSVRQCSDFAGWSHTPTQTIALGTKAVRHGNRPLGDAYRRQTVLHEIVHCCLSVTDCEPDRDAKAGVEDVEERAVAALTGPLLAVLRDHPELVAWLTAK